MLIFFIVFVVIDVDDIDEADEAVAIADTNEAVAVVGAVDVVTVVLVVFCGQNLEKWPICLQCQHCGFQPSTIMAYPRSSVYGVLPGNLLYLGTW